MQTEPTDRELLAQMWKIGPETITSVYQPATSSQSIPPNPYGT
jgi:hypothetical protein